MSARAALDAARATFTAAADSRTPSELWSAAQQVLQVAFSTPALDAHTLQGHALIGEGRRVQAITLSDAHALVSLMGWIDRLREPSPDLAEQWTFGEASVAAEAWEALERAVEFAEHLERKAAAAAAPVITNRETSSIVTPLGVTTIPTPQSSALPPIAARTGGEGRFAPPSATRNGGSVVAVQRSPRRWRVRWGLLAIALVVVAGVGAVFVVRTKRSAAKAQDFNEAVRAFERGDVDLAAQTFSSYFLTHNRDERPLLYLARIERNRGNLVAAKYHLQKAITIAPTNALAMRELAAALLASGDVELARPFYVRAVELDPTDRSAQGFLACTLHRLGREDEALRFADRAGTGEWTPCLARKVSPPQPPPSTR